jgi:hypothetical protein
MRIDFNDHAMIARVCVGQQQAVEAVAARYNAAKESADPVDVAEMVAQVMASQSAVLIALASIHTKMAQSQHGEPRIQRPSIVIPGNGRG